MCLTAVLFAAGTAHAEYVRKRIRPNFFIPARELERAEKLPPFPEPAEEPEETMPEDSGAEPEEENAAPDLGNFKELLEVLQTLQTRKDWKNSPEYEMITAQKAKVLSQLISSFYHGQDSLDLRDTAWGDCDLPGMPDGGKTNEKRRKKDIGAGFGESYDTDACSVQ